MNRWSVLALLLAIACALALRVPQLANRPLHNDEAVNATKLAALWDRGEYKYDPHEYHGPTLHYFSLPFLALSPAKNSAEFSDAQLRFVTVAFGVGLILLLVLLIDAFGKAATSWAAIFLAVSPAMVFYSRYFIHEMLLVFFTLFVLASGWRYAQSRKAVWAALTGAGVGLMFATKETFVLNLAAILFALVATRLWNRWRAQRSQEAAASIPKVEWTPSPQHIVMALTAGGVVWLLFFNSFFANASGPSDSLATYLPWLNRAGGASPHVQPWFFYFERLLWLHPAKSPVWSEGAILLLALIGTGAGFCGNKNIVLRPGVIRFLAFFTVTLTAIYTVIPYKTPWCALNFWLGMILLAGVGAGALVNSFRNRATRLLMATLIGVGVFHLGLQSWILTRGLASDARNPYVYSQTSPSALELVERVKAIASVSPDTTNTVIKVIAPESYWPLPWYLRAFNHVGWWEQLPPDPFAPVIIVSSKLDAKLDDRSSKAYIMAQLYELRPQVFLELYVERKLWEKFVATLPRE